MPPLSANECDVLMLGLGYVTVQPGIEYHHPLIRCPGCRSRGLDCTTGPYRRIQSRPRNEWYHRLACKQCKGRKDGCALATLVHHECFEKQPDGTFSLVALHGPSTRRKNAIPISRSRSTDVSALLHGSSFISQPLIVSTTPGRSLATHRPCSSGSAPKSTQERAISEPTMSVLASSSPLASQPRSLEATSSQESSASSASQQSFGPQSKGPPLLTTYSSRTLTTRESLYPGIDSQSPDGEGRRRASIPMILYDCPTIDEAAALEVVSPFSAEGKGSVHNSGEQPPTESASAQLGFDTSLELASTSSVIKLPNPRRIREQFTTDFVAACWAKKC